MWKMDRANTDWRQGLAGCLGAWYVPIGERLSVVWDIDDRTALRVRKGRIFRRGAVESGGWEASLICFSNSSWEQLTLST